MELDFENMNTTKTAILDRKQEKKNVKPYRKYQIIIFFLLLLTLILSVILYKENKKLNFYIRESTNLSQKISAQNQEKIRLAQIYNKVEVNYASINELDKELNIDIIHNIVELELLQAFISKNSTILFSFCFKASHHGDDPKIFAEKCKGYSPLVVLIETTDGYRFGGFTTQPFTGEKNEFKTDEEAFIFSFDTKKKYKVTKSEKAIFDANGSFPTFGENDIYIGKNFLKNASCVSDFPKAYEEDINAFGDFILTGGKKKFMVKELEIVNAYIMEKDKY